MTTPTPTPSVKPLRADNGFVIGVFSQPVASMPGWIADGVNTFVQWETSSSPEQWWAGTASEAGANTIRLPVSGTVDGVTPDAWEAWDATQPGGGGLAWALPDEPDGNGITPAALAAQAAAFRANARKLPVYLNVRGGSINGMQAATSPIADYLACADWVCEDFYPITGWGDPALLLENGKILDQIAILAPGRPRLCCIECSNQELTFVTNPQCVTVGQFNAEVWDAVIHGASGIVYFPDVIGGGWVSFDGRPADIVAAMQATNAMLAGLEFESGTQWTLPAQYAATFEMCNRQYQGAPTFIVLNMTAADATLPNGTAIAAQSVGFFASNPFPGATAVVSPSPIATPTPTPIAAPTPTPAPTASPTSAATVTQSAQIVTLKAALASYASKIVALNSQVASLSKTVASLTTALKAATTKGK